MFERYTETARKAIFVARFEASQFGSEYIETEHLLLGILRVDGPLAMRLIKAPASIESIREQVEKQFVRREKISTSVDLPLSHQCRRALANGAEEAERLNHKHIATEHLFLGLLGSKVCRLEGDGRERRDRFQAEAGGDPLIANRNSCRDAAAGIPSWQALAT